MTVASAPGKLVLCGEYAVLDGHPAVVAAVDVRASARVTDVRSAPLIQAVLDAARARGLDVPFNVVVDTTAFSIGGRKLGLGSSAAAAAAAAALVVEQATGALDVPLTWQIARDAHRALQGGGSGVDVAACCFGGLLRFSIDVEPVPAPALPRDIEVLVVDTGASATTQGMVDRVLALPDRAALLTAIGRAATSFLSACAQDDAEALIAAVDRTRNHLNALGAAAGIDIVSEAHARIAALATSAGGAAKPSGAGGGDVAVSFVPRARATELRAALSAESLQVVDVRIGAPGASIDP